ncbi:c-type cytochrome [Arenimonas sp.]|uniref:c-type cytochrome n=1 Tax=Arenimonas sp. TaxID=1872635 RepID=UPI002E3734C0|nr:c-type cytochrome [Arenimonas sp.]HEX4854619.1 c-type cytochrome [Arenimonas sp.]
MKRSRILMLAALAAACSVPALANQRLAENKQCFGCHAVATDGAGPAFKKVATLWRGRKDAEAMLVRTIRQGSSGTGGPHWNKATMPDQAERPLVSQAEAKRLAAWILKQ